MWEADWPPFCATIACASPKVQAPEAAAAAVDKARIDNVQKDIPGEVFERIARNRGLKM